MRLFYRLLPLVITGVRVGWGLVAWLWVGCGLVTLLGALPWLELTVPGLWRRLSLFTLSITLSGLGAGYFSQRTQSPAWQRALARLTHLSRVFVRRALKAAIVYCVVSFLLLFVIGWAALMLLLFPLGYLFEQHYPEQALFARGSQQLVQRDRNLTVLRPLLPGLRLVTHLAPGELDSTWTPVACPTPPLTYLPSDLTQTQAYLLKEAKKARLAAAEERRAQAQQAAALTARQATEQALGYDVLHFELADNWYTPSDERAFRTLRSPLDSTRYGYAKFNPLGTLHVTCDNLGTGSEVLTLAIAQLTGPGPYQLAARRGAAGEASTLVLRRYAAGVGTTFTSRADEPAHVEITRFDLQQRVVEGTFEGRLYSPSGAQVRLTDGEFRLRFRYLRSPSAAP